MNAITPREPADLNAMRDEAFRLHLRQWIESNYPAEIRNPEKRLHWDETAGMRVR